MVGPNVRPGPCNSCQALVDLIGGRTWEQLGDFIVEALPMLFRVMDDVKETTARVAKGCARSVAHFIVKSATIQYSAEEQLADCLRRVTSGSCAM